jgi:hypothetical protein
MKLLGRATGREVSIFGRIAPMPHLTSSWSRMTLSKKYVPPLKRPPAACLFSLQATSTGSSRARILRVPVTSHRIRRPPWRPHQRSPDIPPGPRNALQSLRPAMRFPERQLVNYSDRYMEISPTLIKWISESFQCQLEPSAD